MAKKPVPGRLLGYLVEQVGLIWNPLVREIQLFGRIAKRFEFSLEADSARS